MTNAVMEHRNVERSGQWSLAGAVLGAIVASICCVGPLVLLALGVGGAWASSLRALEPYRPIFIVLTLGFLSFAFYRAYRTSAAATCEADGSCSVPRATRINRLALWIITPVILLLLAFPYITPYLVAGSGTSKGATAMDTKQAVLTVQNLTCGSCAAATRQSLVKLDGVKDARVTLDPPRAVVTYDPTKVTPDSMAQATAEAGFPSVVEQATEQ